MDMDKLFEDLFAAELGREWSDVQSVSRKILAVTPLEPWMEGSARRCLAISYVAFSMQRDDATKRSLRQTAVDEARKSILAYERGASPNPTHLSKCYDTLSMTLHMLAIALEGTQLDAKVKLDREAVTASEKALQLNPGNKDAQENLEKARKSEAVYAEAIKESSGGSKCFVATAACGDPFAPEVILLSAFRDDVLFQSRIGTAFVSLYYILSPPVASVIAQSKMLRRAAMVMIVKPATSLVRLIWDHRHCEVTNAKRRGND